MSCPRTQHRNGVPILRGEKHDISLKILHQAGFETARQAVTLAKLRALAIAPRPSLGHNVKDDNGKFKIERVKGLIPYLQDSGLGAVHRYICRRPRRDSSIHSGDPGPHD